MFSFLKDKLKAAIGRFTKGAEAKPEQKPAEEPLKPEPVSEPERQTPEAVTPKVDESKEEAKPSEDIETKKHKEKKGARAKEKSVKGPQQKGEQKPTFEIIEEKDEAPRIEVIEERAKPEPGPKIDSIHEQPVQKEPAPFPEVDQKMEPVLKKGLFQRITERITTQSLSPQKFDELFWDLEVVLLENNVALTVIERIRDDMRKELVDSKVPIGKTEAVIIKSLKRSVESLFDVPQIDLLKKVAVKQPFVMLFVGVNGVGKTTTIAKVARLLKDNGYGSVMAAADTFRAAAIQQLEEHADRLGTKLIKHDYGSDPAAVAYDAIQYAKAKRIAAVLVDTAGRQHSNTNLMQEIQKVVRVSQPDLKIFVGESITGNDCVEQAQEFNESIGIDAIILSKADVDEKGGAAISISYVTKKPIIFIGTGQGYDSLEPFDHELVTKSLGLEG
jgi:fused signal recognition particle receptor